MNDGCLKVVDLFVTVNSFISLIKISMYAKYAIARIHAVNNISKCWNFISIYVLESSV